VSIFCPEDGDGRFLRKVGNHSEGCRGPKVEFKLNFDCHENFKSDIYFVLLYIFTVL
jgi:hypothetical protein